MLTKTNMINILADTHLQDIMASSAGAADESAQSSVSAGATKEYTIADFDMLKVA